VLKAMLLTKLKVAMAVVLVVNLLGTGGLLSYRALATQAQQTSRKPGPQETTARPVAGVSQDVQKVLDKYRSVRPEAKDLTIYQLEWVPTLKDAKAKAAKEHRPIFFIMVTNPFGNLYTGHC
jgi:hypothetical protein